MSAFPKLSLFHKVLLSMLIIANVILIINVSYNQLVKADSAKIIPASDIVHNDIINNRISKFLEQSQNTQMAVAMLTTASTSCSTGRIVKIFREASEKSQNSKFVIILPSKFSQQDVDNLKSNFKLNFKVERADEELSTYWTPIAEEYEAKGIVVISDNGQITASQDTKEIVKSLAKFK